MNREKFIKRAIAAGVVGVSAPSVLRAKGKEESTYDSLLERVGFDHLPNQQNKTMTSVLHKANTRGSADHGWLNSRHTFSFASYHDPERMHFGVLRVLNDDTVSAGKGFGTHPHDNMEIISIPLEGGLEHKDNMGNVALIKKGDVQVMSAGTGITHSEYNKNTDQEVKFLQIWLFPKLKGVAPRYDQISIKELAKRNEFYQVLSPKEEDQGVWIHQDAWFHLGDFDKDASDTYQLKKEGNGIYAFVLEGEVQINGQLLEARDGFGVWDTKEIKLSSNMQSRVLLMEVPMQL